MGGLLFRNGGGGGGSPRRGGGVVHTGAGRVSQGEGGLTIFFSWPKCPPRMMADEFNFLGWHVWRTKLARNSFFRGTNLLTRIALKFSPEIFEPSVCDSEWWPLSPRPPLPVLGKALRATLTIFVRDGPNTTTTIIFSKKVLHLMPHQNGI